MTKTRTHNPLRIPGTVLLLVVAAMYLSSCSAPVTSSTVAAGPAPLTTRPVPPTATTPLAAAVLSVALEPATVSAGATFTVRLVVQTQSPFRGAQWSLQFDPATMRCDSVNEGPFFRDWADANGGVTVIYPQPAIDNQAGKVSTMGIAIMAPTPGGASGQGVLCVYSCTALSDVVMPPRIVDASLADVKGNMFKATVRTAD